MLDIFNKINKKNNFFNKNLYYVNDINKEKDNKIINSSLHYPPNIQEWYNSLYTYNKNYIKLIPNTDEAINYLIFSFFNIISILKKNVKFKGKRAILKEKSTDRINRIFISKTLIKHTNNKVIITLFTYNREKLFYLKKIFDLYLNKKKIKREASYNHINKKRFYDIKLLRSIFKKKSILSFNNFIAMLNNINIKYKKFISMKFKLQELHFNYYKLLLLNNYKFKDFFLSHLKSAIRKIYNKNVEFNIINLKQLSLNTDIFLQVMDVKLRNRNNTFLNVINKSLGIVKPVNFNKYRILKPSFLIKNINLIDKHDLIKFLSKIFSYSNNNTYHIEKSNILRKSIINNLKNKYVKGIKIEASGRLTKRLVASRSVSKIIYKGSIKDIDSSYKCLSKIMLKGYEKSSIQYAIINSETQNGSFGLKGWISSY